MSRNREGGWTESVLKSVVIHISRCFVDSLVKPLVRKMSMMHATIEPIQLIRPLTQMVKPYYSVSYQKVPTIYSLPASLLLWLSQSLTLWPKKFWSSSQCFANIWHIHCDLDSQNLFLSISANSFFTTSSLTSILSKIWKNLQIEIQRVWKWWCWWHWAGGWKLI